MEEETDWLNEEEDAEKREKNRQIEKETLTIMIKWKKAAQSERGEYAKAPSLTLTWHTWGAKRKK